MSSLRDQLLGLGFKPAPKPERPADRKPGNPQGKPQGKPQHARNDHSAGKPQQRPAPRPAKPPRTREEIDLAKAYALRAQREKDERIAAEAAQQADARTRREA